jgi:uncharacterized protein (DUF4213/DUF364 family)
MTQKELYEKLYHQFLIVLNKNYLENDDTVITCKALNSEEAIGQTKRKDFPIIAGKDVMIQAEYQGFFGQAFTDAPANFSGTITDILKMDIVNHRHDRSIFIAVLNAVMRSLNLCNCTVHCRTEGPEYCAQDMLGFLTQNYPTISRIGLIGYQPALLEMLSKSKYEVRVLDLNPNNIGQERYQVMVEDGIDCHEQILQWADLILCTGSTICNGTIVDYIDVAPEVLFFGITLSGSAKLLGLKHICFSDNYQP